MHLSDATWLEFVNPKEENNASVKSICDKSLLKPREHLLLLKAILLLIFDGG